MTSKTSVLAHLKFDSEAVQSVAEFIATGEPMSDQAEKILAENSLEIIGGLALTGSLVGLNDEQSNRFITMCKDNFASGTSDSPLLAQTVPSEQ
jgi:hypothetical protein